MPGHLDTFTWSKSTIATLFKIGLACVVAGSVGGTAVVVWAVASGAVAFGGPQVVTIEPGPVASAVVGLTIASALTITGTVATIVSWVAALLNTVRLRDKAWLFRLPAPINPAAAASAAPPIGPTRPPASEMAGTSPLPPQTRRNRVTWRRQATTRACATC